jgi:hypothetical protein
MRIVVVYNHRSARPVIAPSFATEANRQQLNNIAKAFFKITDLIDACISRSADLFEGARRSV